MSLYLLKGTLISGSLQEKIEKYGYSPMERLVNQPSKKYYGHQDGHADSLKHYFYLTILLSHSEKHRMAYLLTAYLWCASMHL